jgi:signal transduction histidine kinase
MTRPRGRTRIVWALAWPAALIVLVGVLAWFQYRWLGQVSDADRQRRQAALNQRARDVGDEFDREIGKIYGAMQFDADAPDAVAAFAARYEAWRDAAATPTLVQAVYLTGTSVDSDTPPPVQRYSPDARAFVDAPWPDALAAVRDRVTAAQHRIAAPPSPFSSGGNAIFRFVAVGQSPVVADVPALLISVQDEMKAPAPTRAAGETFVTFDVEPRYVIVLLDRATIVDVILPALVHKYLGVEGYRVEVLPEQADGTTAPIFTYGLGTKGRIDPAKADATASIFSVRMDALRDTLQTVRGLPASLAAGRMSILVQQRDRAQVERDAVTALEVAGATHTVAPPGVTPTTTSFTVGPGAWRLVLQHPAGSLDAAVNNARRRNLALSFGVLAILSVSVLLISINAQRAERLAAQQMDFVATVSHELRTPLAVIRSAAQNLSAGVVHDANQAQRYGDLIDTEGRRLTEMVEEVLEFAGIAGGRREFAKAPADIEALTRDVVASCDALTRAAGFDVDITVAGAPLPLVAVDDTAYRRAVSNLITNALKYASDGRWIGIHLAAVDGMVRVTVSDRGRGIESADLPHIFEDFYRGQYAKDRQIHGNGLGLSLVRRIVEAHGGKVTVASSLGQGAAFTVLLPIADAPAGTAAGESQ